MEGVELEATRTIVSYSVTSSTVVAARSTAAVAMGVAGCSSSSVIETLFPPQLIPFSTVEVSSTSILHIQIL